MRTWILLVLAALTSAPALLAQEHPLPRTPLADEAALELLVLDRNRLPIEAATVELFAGHRGAAGSLADLPGRTRLVESVRTSSSGVARFLDLPAETSLIARVSKSRYAATMSPMLVRGQRYEMHLDLGRTLSLELTANGAQLSPDELSRVVVTTCTTAYNGYRSALGIGTPRRTFGLEIGGRLLIEQIPHGITMVLATDGERSWGACFAVPDAFGRESLIAPFLIQQGELVERQPFTLRIGNVEGVDAEDVRVSVAPDLFDLDVRRVDDEILVLGPPIPDAIEVEIDVTLPGREPIYLYGNPSAFMGVRADVPGGSEFVVQATEVPVHERPLTLSASARAALVDAGANAWRWIYPGANKGWTPISLAELDSGSFEVSGDWEVQGLIESGGVPTHYLLFDGESVRSVQAGSATLRFTSGERPVANPVLHIRSAARRDRRGDRSRLLMLSLVEPGAPTGHVWMRGLLPGAYEVTAHFHNTVYGDSVSVLEVGPSEHVERDFHIDRGVTVFGEVVVRGVGDRLPGGWVYVTNLDGPQYSKDYPVGPDGRVAISGLREGGRYELQYVPGGDPRVFGTPVSPVYTQCVRTIQASRDLQVTFSVSKP